LLRKFFYVPSAEIYGGVGGLYDFGPPGCALKANLLTIWRKHFVLTENMLEVSSSVLTPEIVLRTSGHVDKFTDFMVRDEKTADCHRADKILEDHIDRTLENKKTPVTSDKKEELLAVRTQADAYSQEELADVLKKYEVKAPDTGNDISDPFPFNLMFQTSIGPTGKAIGYLRPETAQGIFVNFRRLLEYNGGRMPFAAAQIGLAFRNEISPRSGLLRVREFPMAEIEHFCHPKHKDHPKFKKVADTVLSLLSKENQTGEDVSVGMKIGDAVEHGVVNNETLGYFMARTHLFLLSVGIKRDKLRFRQHKSTEMAHYATDCWDAEIHTTYGWVECVGHADRSAFDLQAHTNVSKVDLNAQVQLDPPKLVKSCTVRPNMGILGRTFRADAKLLQAYLQAMDETKAMEFREKLKQGPQDVKMCNGKTYNITTGMVDIKMEEKKVSVEKFIPAVIEPSFGVGRVMYAILEHSYVEKTKNGDVQRMLHLNPSIAPIKIAILPLGSTPDFVSVVEKIKRQCVQLNLSSKADISGASIGRKYARADEVGVPYALTLDFETLKDNTVTVRDRDTTEQIRLPFDEATKIVSKLVRSLMVWPDAYKKYPVKS